MSAKIKNGDEVVVLTGKDRGKIGKVIKVIHEYKRKRVIVSGINIYKKHSKPKTGNDGGIINKELPIDISNIGILDPKYKSSSKVGFKILDGKKVRFSKSSGELVDKIHV